MEEGIGCEEGVEWEIWAWLKAVEEEEMGVRRVDGVVWVAGFGIRC